MKSSASTMKVSNAKSIRIFKSDFCERLSHIHPITPLVFWAPIIAYLFWRSFYVSELPVATVAVFAFSGFFVWTLTEYLLHRFIFHYRAKSRAGKLIMFFAHGIHHSTPQDKTRLVMPVPMAIFLAIMLYTVFRALFGAILVEPFFAAFLVGYLIYDYSHYAIHHFRPRTRFGRMLKQHHMDHHYVDHESKFGVSSPIWDYVFGTKEFKQSMADPVFDVMTEKEVESYNSAFSGRLELPQSKLKSVESTDKMETMAPN